MSLGVSNFSNLTFEYLLEYEFFKQNHFNLFIRGPDGLDKWNKNLKKAKNSRDTAALNYKNYVSKKRLKAKYLTVEGKNELSMQIFREIEAILAKN